MGSDGTGERVWYWHVHHDRLVERLTSPVEERIAYIRTQKPLGEVETRLRLLQPVRNTAVLDACEAAEREAWAACEAAVREARAAYGAAVREVCAAVERLHRDECPGCPWDGQTIFPQAGEVNRDG